MDSAAAISQKTVSFVPFVSTVSYGAANLPEGWSAHTTERRAGRKNHDDACQNARRMFCPSGIQDGLHGELQIRL